MSYPSALCWRAFTECLGRAMILGGQRVLLTCEVNITFCCDIFSLWNVLCYYSGSLKMTGHRHQFLSYLGTEGHSVPSRCLHICLSVCFSQMPGITSDSHFGIHRKRTCRIEKQSGGCLLLVYFFFPFWSFPTMCSSFPHMFCFLSF